MSKSTPSAPDPVQLAAAQGTANVEAAEAQARLNRINEVTPLGSVTFSEQQDPTFQTALHEFNAQNPQVTGGGGGLFSNLAGQFGPQPPDPSDFPSTFTRTTELTPTGQLTLEQQQALGLSLSQLANQQAGRVGETLGTPLDFSGAPQLPQIDEAARLRIEDALFGRQASRLNQRFGDEQDRLDVILANQGIQRGSEAFSESQESFGRTRNDAFDIALQNAIAGGAQEQGRLFGLQQAARNQGIGEIQTLRNQPINDISALLSNSQLSIPNFGAIPQVGVAPPDILGANALALNQGNLRAQQGSQFQNNLFGLGGSLGAAAILAPAASDRRLKKNISYIGRLLNGIKIYLFEYIWGEWSIGGMADEVREIMPEAVINIGGYDHVYYSRIT